MARPGDQDEVDESGEGVESAEVIVPQCERTLSPPSLRLAVSKLLECEGTHTLVPPKTSEAQDYLIETEIVLPDAWMDAVRRAYGLRFCGDRDMNRTVLVTVISAFLCGCALNPEEEPENAYLEPIPTASSRAMHGRKASASADCLI